MNKKRSLIFSIVRGAMAIGIALLVAAILIFISSKGDSLGEKITCDTKFLEVDVDSTGISVANGTFSVKALQMYLQA